MKLPAHWIRDMADPARAIAGWALILAVTSAWGDLKPAASTREELRSCLAGADRLEAERVVIEAAVKRVEAAQRDLQTLSGIYLAARTRATRDAAAAEAYNRKVGLLNALASQLNGLSSRVLAQQDDFNARIEASNRRCAVMAVRQEDQEAVLIERIRRATAARLTWQVMAASGRSASNPPFLAHGMP